jgi:sugar/nucleoside kinase (ribokinase family)
VVVVDGSGERTCLTAPTAVPPLTAGDLAQVALRPGDLVYVSGYELGLGDESMRLADWIAGIDSGQMVLCDLGPWGSRCGPAVLRPVLGRLDWLACSLREAAELCGLSEDSARELVCTGVQRRAPRSGVVVRDGARGCWVAGIGEPAMRVPGTPVDDPLDTTGAGDTHAGAFLAALGLGAAPVEAARQANAAAARHIASLGSGT